MDDYALVLNAGSSSLKFCVYRRPASGRLAAGSARSDRGHRHLAAVLRQGRRRAKSLADRRSWTTAVRDGRDALDALAAWLRSTYGGARVLGVGHRVVHGGARFAAPDDRHAGGAGGAADAGAAGAAPSAVQSGGDRSGLRAAAGRAAGRLLRHRAFIAASRRSPSWFRCRARSASAGVQRYGFHGLSYEYIASVLPQVAPEIAGGRVIVAHLGSGASLCALKNGKSVDSTLGLHRARRALHGHQAGRRRSRRGPLSLSEPRALGQGGGDDSLQEVGLARHLRHQQRHARPACEQRARRPPGRGLLRLPRRQGDRRARRGAWAASTGWCSPPASARTPPRSAGASARPPRGSASSWTQRRTTATDRGSPGRTAGCRPG